METKLSRNVTGATARAADLLAWYDHSRRRLPWRAPPGVRSEPYRVWLSEIMLQQTGVATVEPYFRAFVRRWPDLTSLAAATLDEVLHAWQGLGYYARARHLHHCARQLVGEHGGEFPTDEAELRRLPGIGPYTAAAISAIAFDRPSVVVDGNVERVMARLFAVEAELPAAKGALRRHAASLTPRQRPGDYAQAVMDLGATVCRPRAPLCGSCPWHDGCLARARGLAESLPRRAPRRQRPVRHGVAFWITDGAGAVLMRRRAERGLLGGLMEVPSTDWREEPWSLAKARRAAPLRARWREVPGRVGHGFTHFHLELAILAGRADPGRPIDGQWCDIDRLDELALPTLMKKLVRHVLDAP